MLKVVLGSSLYITVGSAYCQKWGQRMSIDDAVRG